MASSRGAAARNGSVPSVVTCSSPRVRSAKAAARASTSAPDSSTRRRAVRRLASWARSWRLAGSRRPVQARRASHAPCTGAARTATVTTTPTGSRSFRAPGTTQAAAAIPAAPPRAAIGTHSAASRRAIAGTEAPRARSRAITALRRITRSRLSSTITTAATPTTPAITTDIWASAARACGGYARRASPSSVRRLSGVLVSPARTDVLTRRASSSAATSAATLVVNAAGSTRSRMMPVPGAPRTLPRAAIPSSAASKVPRVYAARSERASWCTGSQVSGIASHRGASCATGATMPTTWRFVPSCVPTGTGPHGARTVRRSPTSTAMASATAWDRTTSTEASEPVPCAVGSRPVTISTVSLSSAVRRAICSCTSPSSSRVVSAVSLRISRRAGAVTSDTVVLSCTAASAGGRCACTVAASPRKSAVDVIGMAELLAVGSPTAARMSTTDRGPAASTESLAPPSTVSRTDLGPATASRALSVTSAVQASRSHASRPARRRTSNPLDDSRERSTLLGPVDRPRRRVAVAALCRALTVPPPTGGRRPDRRCAGSGRRRAPRRPAGRRPRRRGRPRRPRG